MLIDRGHVMELKSHWETVYSTKAADAVSWYAPHLQTSLSYVRRTGLPRTAAVIDVELVIMPQPRFTVALPVAVMPVAEVSSRLMTQ